MPKRWAEYKKVSCKIVHVGLWKMTRDSVRGHCRCLVVRRSDDTSVWEPVSSSPPSSATGRTRLSVPGQLWGPLSWCPPSFSPVTHHSWRKPSCRQRNNRLVLREGSNHGQQRAIRSRVSRNCSGRNHREHLGGTQLGSAGGGERASEQVLGFVRDQSRQAEREEPNTPLFAWLNWQGAGIGNKSMRTYFPFSLSLIHFTFFWYLSVILVLK